MRQLRRNSFSRIRTDVFRMKNGKLGPQDIAIGRAQTLNEIWRSGNTRYLSPHPTSLNFVFYLKSVRVKVCGALVNIKDDSLRWRWRKPQPLSGGNRAQTSELPLQCLSSTAHLLAFLQSSLKAALDPSRCLRCLSQVRWGLHLFCFGHLP